MQVILNKKEKEELVTKLYQDGKPIRHQAHLSFETIGKIVRRINGLDDESTSNNMRGKSKESQAMNLFLHGKRSVEGAIELALSSTEVENVLQEYWYISGRQPGNIVLHILPSKASKLASKFTESNLGCRGLPCHM